MHTQLTTVALAAALSSPALGQISVVGYATGGALANQVCYESVLSGDGRHVIFVSRATNLIAGGTTGQQVFAFDRDPDGNGVFDEGNGVTTLMTRGHTGVPGADSTGRSTFSGHFGLDCSTDGRFVVFMSQADNLVPNDTTPWPHFDVFVRDRDPDGNGVFDEGNGVNTRISEGLGGTEANSTANGTTGVAITGDGRHVIFSSASTNLVPNDTLNTAINIYQHDLQIGVTDRVDWFTTPSSSFGSTNPHVSTDGQWVVYTRYTVLGRQVVVVDRQDPTNWREVSVNDNGVSGDATSGGDPNTHGARLSDDGRVVVFQSIAGNLDVTRPGDTMNTWKLIVHDRDADGNGTLDEPGGITTRRFDLDASGNPANAISFDPDPTGDGSVITFTSVANNLVPGDTNPSQTNGWDIFKLDRLAGTLELINRNASGTQSNFWAIDNSISNDGNWVSFATPSTNLDPADTDSIQHIYATFVGNACTPDWNGDGVLNTSDFLAYLNDYNAVLMGNPPVFGDPDLAPPVGVLNTSDFLEFLNLYNAGC